MPIEQVEDQILSFYCVLLAQDLQRRSQEPLADGAVAMTDSFEFLFGLKRLSHITPRPKQILCMRAK